MTKTFKEKWESQIGHLVEIKTSDGSPKLGLLIKVKKSSNAVFQYETFQWCFYSRHERWKAHSRKRKMLCVELLTGPQTDVYLVCREDIRSLESNQ
jgi:hypothetical protein